MTGLLIFNVCLKYIEPLRVRDSNFLKSQSNMIIFLSNTSSATVHVLVASLAYQDP